MNLDYIKSFYLIAHLSSVKEAAQRLHLSQPALSHQLQILEDEFGVQLIDRHTKPLQLTEAGKVLLGRCQELFDWLDEVSSHVKSTQHEMQGKLALAAPMGLGHNWLMPRMTEFYKKYPKIELSIEFLDLPKILDRLEQHRIDCAITIQTVNDSNFVFKPLFEEDMVLVCSPKHALAQSDTWNLNSILNSPWILFSDEDESPQRWIEAIFGKKIRSPLNKITVNDNQSMLKLVSLGKHIAVIPRHQIPSTGFVEINPHPKKAFKNQVFIGYRQRKQISKKMGVLLDHLTTT